MEVNKGQMFYNRRKRKTIIFKDVQTADSIDISKEGMVFGSSKTKSKGIVKVVAKRPNF